jgi:NADH-quinone oxidoreductase subunit M
MSNLVHIFTSLVVLAATLLLPSSALANQEPAGPHLVVETAGGAPLVLRPREGGLGGDFVVRNEGTEPLVVARVAVRSDEDDPRVPRGVVARFEGGGTTATIPPNGEAKGHVLWTPERSPRMRKAVGHVVVTSNDERTGEVAFGFRGSLLPGPAFLSDHLLSWIVFLPLLGLVAVVASHLRGRGDGRGLRWVALGLALVQTALAGYLLATFHPDAGRFDGNDGFQFVERLVWIRSLGAEYYVGVDGASVPLVFLTALVSVVAAIASFSIEQRLRGYYAMFFLLGTGMMGVFVALDLLLFFVFWEVMLLPMYFLIGVWGGPRKEYAAIKFFLYTLAGSVLLLLAFVLLHIHSDAALLVDGTRVPHSWAIPELARVGYAQKPLTMLGFSVVKVAWVALFLGFVVKVPMVPLHTWLPDAHVEAPTAISVILAGVLLKMGTYGLLRVNFTILPEASRWASATIVAFGVLNVVYGALAAMAQRDLKRLVAYSSISHMGFCLLGLGAMTPQGIAGAIVQMFNHGVITSMLFTLVGVLYDRVHTRDIGKFGGMATEMPVFTSFAALAFMASLGLPGLSGFWGEVLAILGAFPLYRVLAIVAATGLILSAGYHLWALQRVFLGRFNDAWRRSPYLEPFGGRFPDVTAREVANLAPLAVLTVVLGVFPAPLFSLIAGGVRDLTNTVSPPGPDQVAVLDVGGD